MNRQQSLWRVRHWILAYLEEVRPIVAELVEMEGRERTRRLTFLTVDLHNYCRVFLRGYYVASATGAWLSTGQQATSPLGMKREIDAINFAVAAKGLKGSGPWRMRDEPAWHDVPMFLRIMNLSKCSTAPGTNAAWSIGTSSMLHLTFVRNYFAHRNRETAVRVKSLGSAYRLGQVNRPEDVLLSRARGRPQIVLEDWLDDLETVIKLMPA
jgi:hypothetical protein